MKKMKKVVLTALALVGLAAGALTLTAFRHSHDPAHLDRMVANRVADLLDDVAATDAQRQQIQAIVDKVVADGKALHATHQGTHKELLALWQADQPDAASVHSIIDARAATMKAFADEVADAMIQVHGILTPEQRAKVTKKLSRHMQE